MMSRTGTVSTAGNEFTDYITLNIESSSDPEDHYADLELTLSESQWAELKQVFTIIKSYKRKGFISFLVLFVIKTAM